MLSNVSSQAQTLLQKLCQTLIYVQKNIKKGSDFLI